MGRRGSDLVGGGPLEPGLAAEVADALRALGSLSRLLLLARLRRGPCTVGELAEAAGLSPSAASHQLRVLRDLGWVSRARDGRHVRYVLPGPHVGDLIDQAVFNVQQLQAVRDLE